MEDKTVKTTKVSTQTLLKKVFREKNTTILVVGAFILMTLFIVLFRNQIFNLPETGSEITPSQIRISNVYSKGFSITYLTNIESNGVVYYGKEVIDLSSAVYDDRGNTVGSYVHQNSIEELNPNTKYYFKICTQSVCTEEQMYGSVEERTNYNEIKLGGDAFEFTTPDYIELKEEKTAYGKVATYGGEVKNVLVMVRVVKGDQTSAWLSDMIGEKENGWAMDLSNARSEKLNERFEIEGADYVEINVYLNSDVNIQERASIDEVSPSTDILLPESI